MDDESDRLEHLAQWMTSPDNRMFARAQVNRVWYHMMGVGQVEPIDDLRATNPPSHPELFERLADEFISSGYSLKQMVRTIAQSRTYQLDSKLDRKELAETEQLDPRLLASAVVRRLTAEQIIDAQSQIWVFLPVLKVIQLARERSISLSRTSAKKAQLWRSIFECSLASPHCLLALRMNEATRRPWDASNTRFAGPVCTSESNNRHNRLGKPWQQNAEPANEDELYWATLSRPRPDELSSVLNNMSQSQQLKQRRVLRRFAVGPLLNSKELLFRN
ncbi:MAG: DUF1553 domain-containing protein [Pirellulales bacterium]